MATAENTTGTETGNQVVGSVVILYGNVKAISPDGTERLLSVNSPIFAHDRIITESDGRTSIVIDDGIHSQIDLGRMSDVVIDEDIFQGASPEEIAEATAEVEQIQEALLAEDFDPTTELEAPAAGGEDSAGGGITVPDFARVTHEGNPTSGAETRGITFDTVGIIEGITDDIPPTVSINAIEGGFTEEGNPVTFEVQIDKVSDSDIKITIDVFSGPNDDATADVDYDSTDGGGVQTYTVIIPAGQTTSTFDVLTYDDSFDENNETFSAQITDASNINGPITIDSNIATGLILDNDEPIITVGDADGAIEDIEVPEGTEALFTVQIDDAAANSSVTLSLADGTAIDADYNEAYFQYSTDDGATWNDVTGAIDIAEGDTTILVRTDTYDDTFDEGDETFDLTATLTSLGTDYTNSGTATIIDNDTPTVTVGDAEGAIEDIEVPEGTEALFTVQIDDAAANSSVTLSLADGTAIDADYNEIYFQYSTDDGATWNDVTGAIDLAEGDTTILVRTDTYDDTFDEGDETFDLTATLTSLGTDYTNSGTATIIDNDTPTVTVGDADGAIGDIEVPEGTEALFTVQIDDAAANSSVTLSLADGTAIDADYNEAYFQYSTDDGATWNDVTGAIDIAEGDTTILVRTDTYDDTFDEGDETFDLTATLTSLGTDYTNSGTATIIDNDTPTVTVGDADGAIEDIEVPEGTEALFTVQIDDAAANSSVTLSLADGTAIDADYNEIYFQYSTDDGATWNDVTGAIDLAEGDTTILVRTDTYDDTFDEGDETFDLTATLTSLGTDYTNSGTATIIDNDTPTVTVGDADGAIEDIEVPEGTEALFTVQIDDAAANSSVTLSLADGTAIDADYNEAYFQYSTDDGATWNDVTGAIDIAEGDTTILVRTDTYDDTFDEGDETFDLTATLTSLGTDYTNSGTATIIDNDTPTVTVGDAEGAIEDIEVPEGTEALFTVQIDDAAANSSVTLSLADGTAIDADYNEAYFQYSTDDGATWNDVTGAIDIAEGDTTILVRTDTYDDTFDEGDETFDLTATLTSLGTDYNASGTATIIDNDTPTVTVGDAEGAIEDIEVPEGTEALFTVQIDDAAANSSVTLSLADGTAIDADYNEAYFQYSTDDGATWNDVTGAIDLAEGDTTILVRTDTYDDTFDEGDETFDLTATLTSLGTDYNASGTATIIDNDTPTVTVGDAEGAIEDIEVPEGTEALFTVQIDDAAANSSVTLSLADGTAIDADYNEAYFQYSTDDGATWNDVTGAIDLAEGDTTILVRTDTYDDTFDEGDETFDLNATLTSLGTDYNASGTATIIDNDTPTVTVGDAEGAIGDIEVPEGTEALFTVQIDDAAANSSVTLSLADGTAIDADYNEIYFQYSTDDGATWNDVTGVIDLAEGDTTILVRTDTYDDTFDEGDETFELNATLTSLGTDYTNSGTATIIDNDDPTVTVGDADGAIGDIEVPEGTEALFTVQIDGAAANSSVTLSLADGTAIDADYNEIYFQYSTDDGATWNDVTGAIDIAEGDTTILVRTDTYDDTFDEGDETFDLTATLTSLGTDYTNSGTATIIDNDTPTVTVGDAEGAIEDIEVPEGTEALFTVQIDDAAANSSVTLSLADGTAIDADYNEAYFQYSTDDGATWNDVTGAIDIAEGDTTILVRTDTYDDTFDEGDETFDLTATLTSLGTDYTNSGTATIIDNDTPTVTVGDAEGAIGDIEVPEGTEALFTVQIDDAAANSSVTLSLADGTAIDADYNEAYFQYSTDDGATWNDVTGAIDLAEGDTTILVRTDTYDDTFDEGDETFDLTATLTSLGTDYTNSGTATIIDNDGPTVTVGDAEGAIGDIEVPEGTEALFTVQIDDAAANSSVTLSLADGTAIDADYNEAYFQYSTDDGATWNDVTGAIDIAEGDTTILVRTDTYDDTFDEGDETFDLTATLTSLGTDYTNSGTATIIDNDTPTVTVGDAEGAIGDIEVPEGTEALFTVQIDDAAANSSVTLSLADGTAIDADYNEAYFQYSTDDGATWNDVTGAIDLAEGDTTILVRTDTYDDTFDEGDETFDLTATLTSLGTDYTNSGTATIIDNDGPTVTVGDAEGAIGDIEVPEGTEALFTVQIDDAAANSSVTLSLADGTAIDADYNEAYFQYSTDDGATWNDVTGAIDIAEGDTTILVRTDTYDDTFDEGDETFDLTATLTSLGTDYTNSGTATIIDNDTPTVTVGDAEGAIEDIEVPEGTEALFTVQIDDAAANSSVTLSLADGTAIDADYNEAYFQYSTDDGATWNDVTGAIDLAEGDTTILVRTDTYDDTFDEGDETFDLTATLTSLGTDYTNSGTATIIDNDTPTVTVGDAEGAIGDIEVPEGTEALFTVQIDDAAANSSVTLSLADGTAIDADYNEAYFQYSTDDGATWNDVTGAIDIAEGDTTILVRTDTYDDTFDEGDETFELNATLTSLGTDYTNSGTATIIDNDTPTVTVGDAEGAIEDIEVPEGTEALFTVQIDDAAANSSVTLSLADGTAIDADYNEAYFQYSTDDGATWNDVTGAIDIAEGDTTILVRTDTYDDTFDEGDETFDLTATLTSLGTDYTNSGTATIIDNDTPTVTVGDAEGAIGDIEVPEGTEALFTVQIDDAAANSSVTLSLADGTAIDADYNEAYFQYSTDDGATWNDVTGAIDLAEGDTTILVRTDTYDDTFDEGDETFDLTATLTSLGTDYTNSGTATIIDNDTPTVTVGDAEGAIGDIEVPEGTEALFTVQIDDAAANSSVTLSLADGTAIDADYNEAYFQYSTDDGATWNDVTGAIDIAEGDTTILVRTDTYDDTFDEGDETFDLTATLTSLGTDYTNSGTATIIDNDTPTVTVGDAEGAIEDIEVPEGTEALFTVQIDDAAANSSVTLSLADGTAIDADYNEAYFQYSTDDGATWNDVTGAIDIAEGDTTILVRTDTYDDTFDEGDETFDLTATLTSLGTDYTNSGTATIIDNDTPTVTVGDAEGAIEDIEVPEGTEALFTVQIDDAAANSSVTLSLADGTAIDADYNEAYFQYSTDDGATWNDVTGAIDIAEGDTTILVRTDTYDDTFDEGDETFDLTATLTSLGTDYTNSGTATIIDNDTPTVTVGDAEGAIEDIEVPEGTEALFTVQIDDAAANSSVTLSLADGTAIDADYNEAYFQYSTDDGATWNDVTGAIDLAEGDTTILVRTDTYDDTFDEGDETFDLTATLTSLGTDYTNSGTATIIDNDTPTVTVGDAEGAIGDIEVPEGTEALFTVQIDDAAANSSVTLSLADGTAIDADYNEAYFQYSTDDGATWNDVTGAIDLAEGDTTILVRTDTYDDTFDEGDETFELNATLTSLGTDYTNSGTATIIDNDTPTVTVGDADGAIEDIEVPEGTEALFTVQIDDAAANSSVTLSLADGTAIDADYNEAYFQYSTDDGATWNDVTGAIDLAEGDTTILVRTDTYDDTFDEGDETFDLTATLTSLGTDYTNSGTATIIDNDTPTVTVGDAEGAIGDIEVPEGTEALFTVQIDDAAANSSVTLSLADGTAIDADYNEAYFQYSTDDGATWNDVTGAIDIAEGDTTILVRTDTYDDTFDEGDETFDLTATLTSLGTDYTNSGTATIIDNDTPTVTVGDAEGAIEDIEVPEGTEALFTVQIDDAAANSSVTLSLADGTAIDADYNEAYFQYSTDDGATWNDVTGAIDIAEGDTTILVRTDTYDDTFDEGDETFDLTATLTSLGTDYTNSGTATIIDNDTPTVTVGDAEGAIGDIEVPEGTEALFTVQIDDAAANSSVTLSLADGTAIDADYNEAYFQYSTDDGATWNDVTGAIDIAEGDTTILVRTDTYDDTFDEGDETFDLTATLTSLGTDYTNSGTATIIDNDTPAVTVGDADGAIEDIEVPEGTEALFTVQIDDAAANSSVTLSLADGTAIDADYNEAYFQYSTDDGATWNDVTGAIDIAEGDTTILVRTDTYDDTFDEGDETFDLTATLTSLGTDYTNSGTATIIDNDTPTVTVGDAEGAIGDIEVPEGTEALFTVQIDDAAANSSVTLSLADGTAIDADYNEAYFQYSTDDGATWNDVTGAIDLAEGDTTILVRTDTYDDTFDEGDETFELNATLTSLGTDYTNSGTATIIDNDTPAVTVGDADGAIEDIEVPEGTEALFTVQIDDAAANSSVTLSLADGTAIDADYNEIYFQYSTDDGATWNDVTGAIDLAEGDTTILVRTDTYDDTFDEGDETFDLTATLTSLGTDYTNSGTATIIDNDGPTVTVGDADGVIQDIEVPEGTEALFTVQIDDAAANSSVTLSLADGTAIDADYNEIYFQYSTDDGATWNDVTGAIDLAEGDTTILVRTDTYDDTFDEGDETFHLKATLTSLGKNYSDSGTATIIDNDEPTITVGDAEGAIEDIEVPEGTEALFTVQIDDAAANSSVTLSLTDGTAIDADYNEIYFQYSTDDGATWNDVTGTIDIAEGDTTILVRTDTYDDTFDEGDETFDLTATLTSLGTDYTNSGNATIIDNDTPTVTVGDADGAIEDIEVPEGTEALFTVQIDGAAANSSVTLSLADGTAIDADYNEAYFQYSTDDGATWNDVTGAIDIAEGDTTILVRTDTYDDTFDEGDETFELNATLTSLGTDYNASGTATIIDNDTPTVTVGDADGAIEDIEVPEGTEALFTVQIDNAAANSSVTLSLADGTAIDADYNEAYFQYSTDDGATWNDVTGAIDIAEGDTTILVRTDTYDDTFDEGDETFDLTATLTSLGTDYTNSGTATIIDNDEPTITVGDAEGAIEDIEVPEGTEALFTVQIDDAAANSSVTLSLADGTAIDADYNEIYFQYSTDDGATWNDVTGAIDITEGDTTILVRTDTYDDTFDEGDETFELNATLTSLGTDYNASGTATIIDNDTTPVVGTSTATVSEEGLTPDGLPDTDGSPSDVSDSDIFTGNISVIDVDGTPLTVTLEAPPANGALTSNGMDIEWSGQDTNTLVGSAGGNAVITISIADNGNYTVNLDGPIDHPTIDIEDVSSFDVTVRASDGSQSSTGILTVNIEDDSPDAGDITVYSSEGSVTNADVNILITLDLSGSMDQIVDYNNVEMTRLAATKLATMEMLNNYESSAKNVMVQIVTFEKVANTIGENSWMSVAEANNYLSNLSDYAGNGGTNYDAALFEAQSAFDVTGKIDGAINVSYFLSDGVPTISNSHPDYNTNPGNIYNPTLGDGIGTELADSNYDAIEFSVEEWESFLEDNLIKSYSLGIGTGATQTTLNPIAYDGIASEPMTGILVTEESQLNQVLEDTVGETIPASPVSGNLLEESASGADQWAGEVDASAATVTSVTYNSITHDLSSASAEVTIDLGDVGTVVINGNGNYTWQPGGTVTEHTSVDLEFTVMDGDGDTDTAGFSLTMVNTNDAPFLANINPGVVNESGLDEGTQLLPNAATADGQLIYNDADADTLNLVVNGISIGVLDGSASTEYGLGGTYGDMIIRGDGSWTYTLMSNTSHDTDDATYIDTEVDSYIVAISDGTNTSQPKTLNVNINDDTIQVTQVSHGHIANEADLTLNGIFNVVGADNDFYAADLNGNTAPANISFGGQAIHYYVDSNAPSTLLAVTDLANPYDTKVFTLEVDPNDDSYTLTTHEQLDTITTYDFDLKELSYPSGPVAEMYITDQAGYSSPDDVPSDEVVRIIATTADPDSIGTPDLVNGSTQGLGIDNQWIGDDIDPNDANLNTPEELVLNFVNPVVAVEIGIDAHASGPAGVTWAAYTANSDNPIAFDTAVIGDGSFNLPDFGVPIVKVILGYDSNYDYYRVSSINISETSTENDINIDFNVDVFDSDNDSTSTAISIELDGDNEMTGTLGEHDVFVGGPEAELFDSAQGVGDGDIIDNYDPLGLDQLIADSDDDII